MGNSQLCSGLFGSSFSRPRRKDQARRVDACKLVVFWFCHLYYSVFWFRGICSYLSFLVPCTAGKLPILGNTEWKATTAVFSAALFMPSTKRALVILCEHSRADTDADIDTNIERTQAWPNHPCWLLKDIDTLFHTYRIAACWVCMFWHSTNLCMSECFIGTEDLLEGLNWQCQYTLAPVPKEKQKSRTAALHGSGALLLSGLWKILTRRGKRSAQWTQARQGLGFVGRAECLKKKLGEEYWAQQLIEQTIREWGTNHLLTVSGAHQKDPNMRLTLDPLDLHLLRIEDVYSSKDNKKLSDSITKESLEREQTGLAVVEQSNSISWSKRGQPRPSQNAFNSNGKLASSLLEL